MDWIRAWILQVAGLIVLSSICDVIMMEGSIKKYVKPVLGLVLIFTIIRPITALSEDKLRLDILQDSMGQGDIIASGVDNTQRMYIADMYEKKLSEKMIEEVGARYGMSADISVLADRKNQNIGGIDAVKVTISAQEGKVINTESIKRYIAEKFGIKEKIVQVTLKER